MTFEDICRISTASGDVGKTAVDMTDKHRHNMK
jgi:hypothetical protein